MTSSFHHADRKGDSFGRAMYPLGFIVIALMFLKSRKNRAPSYQNSEAFNSRFTFHNRIVESNYTLGHILRQNERVSDIFNKKCKERLSCCPT